MPCCCTRNLRDWPDTAGQDSSCAVGAVAPPVSESSDGQDIGLSDAVGGSVRTEPRCRPHPLRPEPTREPREGVQHE
jgi:hypothetical protein